MGASGAPKTCVTSWAWTAPAARARAAVTASVLNMVISLSFLGFHAGGDGVDGAVRRQEGALLPRRNIAQMIAGEIDRPVRLVEQGEGVRIGVRQETREAVGVRNLLPVDDHRRRHLAGLAGVQAVDRV